MRVVLVICERNDSQDYRYEKLNHQLRLLWLIIKVRSLFFHFSIFIRLYYYRGYNQNQSVRILVSFFDPPVGRTILDPGCPRVKGFAVWVTIGAGASRVRFFSVTGRPSHRCPSREYLLTSISEASIIILSFRTPARPKPYLKKL